jgi:hypothetical protein
MGQSQSQGDTFMPPGVLCCDSAMEYEVRWKKRQNHINSPTPKATIPPEMRSINGTVRHAPAAATSKGTDNDLKLQVGNTGQVARDANLSPKQLSSASGSVSGLHSPNLDSSRLSSRRFGQTDGTECAPVGRLCQFADDKPRYYFAGSCTPSM